MRAAESEFAVLPVHMAAAFVVALIYCMYGPGYDAAIFFMRGSKMTIRRIIGDKKQHRMLAFLLFVTLLWQVFSHLTYLFRLSDDGRLSLLAFKNEAEKSVDVVYIGASSVQVFWDPMCAWDQHGFTSYSYAISSMPVTTYLPIIKQIEKSKEPKLFIIEVRTTISPNYEQLLSGGVVNAGGYRYAADSMDISLDRAKLISYTCKIDPGSVTDSLASYLDLIYYHTNISSLSNPRNWILSSNTTGNIMGTATSSRYLKGFMTNPWTTARVALFPGFLPPRLEERSPLNPGAERCYRDLLSYCSDNDIPLLVTATPKISSEYFEEQINTCEDIAAEYGIPFLNLNTPECWEAMGLDPETDFYNVDHLNVVGAGKFTTFFADYLATHYDLPDHRDDPRYDSWQEFYEGTYLPAIEPLKEQVRDIVADYNETVENEEKMCRAEDAAEWFSYADDHNITLLITADGRNKNAPSSEATFILDKFGLSPRFREMSNTYIGVYSGSILLSDVEMTSYEGDTATYEHPSSYRSVHYAVQLGAETNVEVGEDEFTFENSSGMNIVAIDNNYLTVVDCVSVDVDSEGALTLAHIRLD